MKANKRFLAYDGINNDYESFETIEEARSYLEDGFLDRDEGYHPDLESCVIYELKETVEYEVIDKKSNYKYENEEDIPDDDTESEAWGHGSNIDEIWQHKFVPVNRVI